MSLCKCVSASRKTTNSCWTSDKPALQGDRFAAVGLPNESDARIVPRDFFDFGGGLIARAVVDHQHFDCARIIVRQNGAQGRGDHFLLIEGGDQNTDRRAQNPPDGASTGENAPRAK